MTVEYRLQAIFIQYVKELRQQAKHRIYGFRVRFWCCRHFPRRFVVRKRLAKHQLWPMKVVSYLDLHHEPFTKAPQRTRIVAKVVSFNERRDGRVVDRIDVHRGFVAKMLERIWEAHDGAFPMSY